MRLLVWTRNEGITDNDFKDGDIFQVRDNAWEPGARELQRWLCVEMPDYSGNQEELVAPEYSVGPGNEAVIRRMRKYRLDYAPKLDPEELAAAKDRDATVPIVTDRFTLDDIVRK